MILLAKEQVKFKFKFDIYTLVAYIMVASYTCLCNIIYVSCTFAMQFGPYQVFKVRY